MQHNLENLNITFKKRYAADPQWLHTQGSPFSRLYGMMEELRVIREDLDEITQIAGATGLIEAEQLGRELRKLRQASRKIALAVTGDWEEE